METSWAGSIRKYSANNSTEVSGYAAGTLYKTIQIDGEGQNKITFTDKRGNLILQRTKSGTQEADTYYEYDDKDRLTLVIPPDATANDANLIFENTYYGNDLIQSKKVPDRAEQKYWYNYRDLLSYYEDGYLLNKDKQYAYKYDGYGRLIKEGFANETGITNDSFATASIETVLSKFEYGTSGVELDKVIRTDHSFDQGSSFHYQADGL